MDLEGDTPKERAVPDRVPLVSFRNVGRHVGLAFPGYMVFLEQLEAYDRSINASWAHWKRLTSPNVFEEGIEPEVTPVPLLPPIVGEDVYADHGSSEGPGDGQSTEEQVPVAENPDR